MKKNKEFLKLLIDKDLSKVKVAQFVGVSWQTIYYWSIGRSKPSAGALIKLSEILDMSIEQLYKLFSNKETK
ncbi:MAG: helix-turn-helix transcriptional regulator [Clostridia bacterium]|nr:helix-turn-helix transcriptional regulator [Clostridia bacterium]